jgi:hypothetical protein
MESSSGPSAKVAIPRLRWSDQQTVLPKPPPIRSEIVNKAVSTAPSMNQQHDADQGCSALDAGSIVGIISKPILATWPTSCFVWIYCAS